MLPDWLVLGLGLAILGMIFADRRLIRSAWRRPARWYSRDPDEYMRSRGPAQPLNVLVGLPLGIAAVLYGAIGLLT